MGTSAVISDRLLRSYTPLSSAAPPSGAAFITVISRHRSLSSPSRAVTSLPPRYSWSRSASASPLSRASSSRMSCNVWVLPARPSVSSTARASTVVPAARH